jgi:radical SAM protein with 4Fe4S-binding SPASM domain
MSDLFIVRMLAPLANARRRSLIRRLYPNPLDFVRRAYLHLEHTVLKRRRVLTLPVRAKLNTGYTCNLRCPLCPTGRYQPAPSGRLTTAMARSLLSRLKKVRTLSLFGWAEPFLNPDIFEVIDLLKKDHKKVAIDSNLSIKNTQVVEKLAQTPIDTLSVSLDGADEESYSKYRIGGSFELVIRNIRRLKASLNGPRRIQWQYIVSRKNHHLVEKAKALGKELGVEMYFMDIGMYNEMFYESSDRLKREWWTDEQRERLEKPPQKPSSASCMFLYNDPFIDFNGDVYPCCHAPYAPKEAVEAGFKNVFGNLHDNSLKEIWNNSDYQAARSLFSGRGAPNESAKPICLRCKVYLERNPASSDARLPIFNGDTSSKVALHPAPNGSRLELPIP